MFWRGKKESSIFLFSYDPDKMEEGGKRWYLPADMSDEEYREKIDQCQEEVGDRFLIMNSEERPEFVAKPTTR